MFEDGQADVGGQLQNAVLMLCVLCPGVKEQANAPEQPSHSGSRKLPFWIIVWTWHLLLLYRIWSLKEQLSSRVWSGSFWRRGGWKRGCQGHLVSSIHLFLDKQLSDELPFNATTTSKCPKWGGGGGCPMPVEQGCGITRGFSPLL